jgi:hypothetical protein
MCGRTNTGYFSESVAMMSKTEHLEQRVAEIERELARLRSVVLQTDKTPWWRQLIGEFEGDDDYAEIARLGSQLRQADQPE